MFFYDPYRPRYGPPPPPPPFDPFFGPPPPPPPFHRPYRHYHYGCDCNII